MGLLKDAEKAEGKGEKRSGGRKRVLRNNVRPGA